MSSLESSSRRLRLARRLVVLAAGLLICGFGPAVESAVAATTPVVNLGLASSYAVLSGASVGNTVNAAGAPFTTLRGDLGVAASTQPTGFPPGIVTGTIRVGSTVAPAYADLLSAYNDVAGRTGGTALPGDLAGVTLSPGLHSTAAAVANTGTVTLDGGGDPNAVFVFQIGGALAMAAGSNVTLTNGASAANVFWQVAGAASVGANSKFAGTLMANPAIAVGAGTVFNGRALSLNGAISLDSDDFYSAPPVVTIAGGATAITDNSTPTISGTTDVAPPGVVTVTIAGQTLTATPAAGSWSVKSASVANGAYSVVASATDGAGNQGSATQQLTVDTVAPVITLDGGPSVLTNDRTPTISGTSNVAAGTVVHATVGTQHLTALVQPGGAWNVRTTALSDGTRTVTAVVRDPAGNRGTASQVLTIDTRPPVVTITGGERRLTNQKDPVISGTANVAVGTTVTVTLADQTLKGLVQQGGTWSVTAVRLADGPHRVIMSVSDGAGNRASFTQILTVDTVAPTVTITGGAAWTTYNLDPTIRGTSNAAAGTTVTVSVAGQTMQTLLQANHTWNATPTLVGEGTWQVVASASDPAGNVGSAWQTLTIVRPVALNAFTPTSGPTGTDVTITGHGFTSGSIVKLSGVTATVLSRALPTELIVTIPATATSGMITVTNTTTPVGTATSVGSYTVTPHSPPTISSFTPASGITGGSVTITGTFLSGASSVKFGTLAASYELVSATEIKATVPNGASAGKISVSTAVATATSSAMFTPTLSVTSMTPVTGPTGTHVTITGHGFTSGSIVKVDGVAATVLSRALPIQLIAIVRANTTSGKITVTNPTAPVGTAASVGSYTVTPHSPPTISSFTPAAWITGRSVTITGTFLSGASSVRFGKLAASYEVVSATQIKTTVPNGASTGKISVTTAVAVATSSAAFRPTLSITNVTPVIGPTGTHVTITGVGFTSGSTVQLGGVAATVLSRALPNELIAIVPANAISGKITVTNTTAPIGTVSSASSYAKT